MISLLTALCLPISAQAQDSVVPESREDITLSFAPVVKGSAPAVVNIYTKKHVIEPALSPMFGDPFFQQFFGQKNGVLGMPRERVISSLGSGVMVAADGKLVTNYHVVNGAEDIRVVFSDRREYEATVVLADKEYDLAILQLKTKGEILPYLNLDDSDALQVGDLVLAIGNPFGVGQTVTSGIVSALARSAQNINDFSFFIQTDASINPGNSGGALIDMHGNLVGIPTAIYSSSGGSNGIGFAIPSNMVKALLAGKQQDGRIVKPWLGASYQPVTLEIAESLGLNSPRGVLLGEVYKGGPAERSGLKAGDVIVAINAQPVDDVQALRFRTAIAKIDQTMPIEFIRNGEHMTASLIVSLPPETPARDMRTLKGTHPMASLTVANLNPALATELNLNPMERGVVVMEDGRNFRAGDMILSVNGNPMESVKQLDKTLQERMGNDWRIDFKRGDRLLSLRVVE